MTNNRPTQNLKQNVIYLLFIYQSGTSIQVYNVYMYSKYIKCNTGVIGDVYNNINVM